ncbi:MAG: NUDIX hydrolase [Bacteroidia bacterium]|nr:NUDIX hydrolase [Bacteroidia bacterium]
MPLTPWKKVKEEILHANPWWTYKRDQVLRHDDSHGEYHYVETPGSVMVIPRTAEGEFLLVRQYRHLNQRESIEFPAGGVKAGQSWDAAARAELREEAGTTATTLTLIGSFNPFNGVTNEICRVYAASGLAAVAAQPDPSEQFEVLVLTETDIHALIAAGELWDGMSLAAWSLYRNTQFGAQFVRGDE